MQEFGAQLDRFSALDQLVVPDLWQQEAVQHLRAGKDVVVHAATGAGKTFIFELWSNEGRNPGQAIYTVPTRALANDKLAEWRARGWNVGIATGDLSENLDAPVIVATLETQKNRLINGDGPRLLVIDEYQMLGDADRGLNYELAIAMAPPKTQLLMLSGSVANPKHVVAWLQRRLGRDAEWVWHDDRPVPLEEVYAGMLNYDVPPEIRGYWPRFAAKALAEGLGPVLIFAPRRRAHAAGGRQRLEKGYLPLDHELRLRRALVLGVEVGVEDDGVGYRVEYGGRHHGSPVDWCQGTGLLIQRGTCRTEIPIQRELERRRSRAKGAEPQARQAQPRAGRLGRKPSDADASHPALEGVNK